MLYINNLTSNAIQQMTLTGIPGVTINMTLRFLPRIQQWIMGINDGTLDVNGIAVVSSLNLLRQWKNIIPYGISCVPSNGLDPYQITDFLSQAADLYLLNATDVAEIESEWFS